MNERRVGMTMAVALLSLMLLSSCTDNEKSTGWQLTRERMADVAAAIVIFERDRGALPQSLSELKQVGTPYFEQSMLTDAWGNPMNYRLPAEGSKEFGSAPIP